MKIKIYAACFASIIVAINVYAQTNIFPSAGAAGIGTTTPNTSSLLEIKSIKKGVLIPRMTKAQRNAIASPATGWKLVDTKQMVVFKWMNFTYNTKCVEKKMLP